ncbi:hypothetical protein EGW08_001639 [Elysia chlorotica]|uniref:CXXC-type domain-containing protein n=1 Tax=Elysia chlorotica TaxID=188477 RepID=A0A433UA20_ELYCH|nr:hypothetical protein EGW08_001639 [Elysia chlorotica]
MSAVFHGHPMHVPSHHLHHHNSASNHHNPSSSSNNSGNIVGGVVDTNGGPGFMLDDGSGVVGGVGGVAYPHDGMTPPGMVWDPSLQGDGGGKFRLKRRRRCGQCAPCQVKENCNKCQYCMRKDVLKQACIYRKCVYLRKPVPRFRQDGPTPNSSASPPSNGGAINKPSTPPPRKSSSNNNTSTNNNNINGLPGSTSALSNCSSNSNGSTNNNSNANGTNSTATNHLGGGASNGGSSHSSSSGTTNANGTGSLHHSTPSATGGTELSSCRLNQSPFGANPPGANGVNILDPLRHRSMMDAHYQQHRGPGGPPFFDPMAAQLPATGSPHHHQHDLTPAAAAAAAVAAAAAAGNTMSPHHAVPHLNAHGQATKLGSSSSTPATSREAAAAATTYFPHPAESWGSAVPYAAFPRAPSWAASAYGFQQHSSPFASSFTPSSFPPSPFPGSSCRLSLPDSGSSSSASRYGPAGATSTQHPFHHSMTGISGFTAGDALSHAQYSHHPAHPHAHSNMRSSFYPPAPPTGHLGSSSTLSSFPSLAPPSFGPSPYHPHPHSHMYPGSFYSSLRAATEPQIYHVQAFPSQNPFKMLLQQTCDFLDNLNDDKSEIKPFHEKLESSFQDSWKTTKTLSVLEICCSHNDEAGSLNSNNVEKGSKSFLAEKTQDSKIVVENDLCTQKRQNMMQRKTSNSIVRSNERSNIPFGSYDDKTANNTALDLPHTDTFNTSEAGDVVVQTKDTCSSENKMQSSDNEEVEERDINMTDVSKVPKDCGTPDEIVHKDYNCGSSCVQDLGESTESVERTHSYGPASDTENACLGYKTSTLTAESRKGRTSTSEFCEATHASLVPQPSSSSTTSSLSSTSRQLSFSTSSS